ncbi:MAG: glycosyltransferase [Prolixibacteraceae bacterium]|nr:glycosyltransferase [Prolixibacteraceae bacterium]
MAERRIYVPDNLALVVPTKDRPEKIKNLLESIASQDVALGRIIIIDGGESVEDIVSKFSARLPVEYYRCSPPGQIRQRNMAISKLDGRTCLVCFFDDDIVLMPGALKEMIDFWNTVDPETAGVSFNIINMPPDEHSTVKWLMASSVPQRGKVLWSGRNTSISNLKKNIRSQWLCGGATVWKQDIVVRHMYNPIDSKWAICEDLIFSYPLGKNRPLYVCADAKVRHEHVYDHKVKQKHVFYGRTETLWRLYFVNSHRELSKILFFWNLAALIIARFVMGIFTFNRRHIQFGLGQLQGALWGLWYLIRRKDIIILLEK